MTSLVTVREFAVLAAESGRTSDLDGASVSKADFEWLAKCSQTLGLSGMPITALTSPTTLRLSNYVGVLETPSGTRIEILPKHVAGVEDVQEARALLRKMIATALDLPKHAATPTDLQVFSSPVCEWIIHSFLTETKQLLARGLRSEYREISSEERFIRGRLHAVRQLRQPPSRQHLAQVQFDVFVHDRAENRLIRSAVDAVLKVTKVPASWRLAQEFRARLHEIPFSPNFAEDFRAWRDDRLSASYAAVRPWCELILRTLLPVTVLGAWRGVSLLFPMEKLFERYVACWLREALDHRAKLHAPGSGESLCQHRGNSMFQLRPDLLVDAGGRRWVLDTKWKLLDGAAQEAKYGLSEADFYQLFAYGSRYLAGREGELALIYPAAKGFQQALPMFQFSDRLRLWVVPFDLRNDKLLMKPQTLQLPLSCELLPLEDPRGSPECVRN